MPVNAGDTAWILVSAALVMLMTPGLALFYGGMVRRKNVLSTMMMSFVMLGMVGILWVLYGYSLSFAPGNSLIGGLSFLGLNGVGQDDNHRCPVHRGYCGQGQIQRAACLWRSMVDLYLCSCRALGVGRRLAGETGRARFCRRRRSPY
jgi:hypothetical protein